MPVEIVYNTYELAGICFRHAICHAVFNETVYAAVRESEDNSICTECVTELELKYKQREAWGTNLIGSRIHND